MMACVTQTPEPISATAETASTPTVTHSGEAVVYVQESHIEAANHPIRSAPAWRMHKSEPDGRGGHGASDPGQRVKRERAVQRDGSQSLHDANEGDARENGGPWFLSGD